MDKSEFEAALRRKFKTVKSVSVLSGVLFVINDLPKFNYIEFESRTVGFYSNGNLEIIIDDYPKRYKAAKKEFTAWKNTKEGKQALLKERIETLSKDIVVAADQHGFYRSGDYVKSYIREVITNKRDLKKAFACGDFLAIVSVSRSRTYSKAYTRNFGTGDRTDVFLVGLNETGTKFAHQVPDSTQTVKEALNWIWDSNVIASRHGDIAISKLQTDKKYVGEYVGTFELFDSHLFTGELCKKGSKIYVKNGILHHSKNQHPDVIVSDDWYKIIVGKRFHKGIGGTRD